MPETKLNTEKTKKAKKQTLDWNRYKEDSYYRQIVKL